MHRCLLLVLALASAGRCAMVSTTPEGVQKRLARARAPTSWQKRLDKALLDVDKSPKQRVRLLQNVAKDAKTVSSDLRIAVEEVREKGMGKGHPLVLDLLFPTGSTVRSDLEGLAALRKQVPELINSIKPPTPEELQKLRTQAAAPPNPVEVASALAALAFDEAKQRELVQEAKNALRATPKGLETPRYKVLRTWAAGGALDGEVELRQYAPFTVAKKQMGSAAAGAEDEGKAYNSLEGGGGGFNSLASYLFGANEQKEAMAMTMPVEIETSAEGASTMSFVLPRANADAPPLPDAADVQIESVGARLVAAKAFGGIVTDEEVARQRDVLLAAIGADGGTRPLDADAYSVLQYNAPYTVPWRRRNELAIVVEVVDDPAEVVDEPAEEGGVSSWYDRGVRL